MPGGGYSARFFRRKNIHFRGQWVRRLQNIHWGKGAAEYKFIDERDIKRI